MRGQDGEQATICCRLPRGLLCRLRMPFGLGARRGRQHKQAGRPHTCGSATLNALCRAWCEASCGQKSNKQTPLGLRRREEQSHIYQWPSPTPWESTAAIPHQKAQPGKGPLGRKGLSASPARAPHLQTPASDFNCSFCPSCVCHLCFPLSASSSLDTCQFSTPGG